ncbi:MAG: ThuA domain-containing protein [Candidatus Glassbacteria bacterium]|nr:ThuA domain-containing protein [Candidatus Glassbacteria bacterium]
MLNPLRRLNSLAAVVLFCLVAGAPAAAGQEKKEPLARLLLLTGVDRYHDWKANSEKVREILQKGGLEVVITEDPWVLTTPAMESYDGIVMVMNTDNRWPPPVEQALAKHVGSGKALGIIHSANNCFPGWSEFEDMVGLLWRIDDVNRAGHDHYGPYTVEIVDKQHFITRDMQDFPVTDELYRDLTKYSDYHVLAEAFSKDKQARYPLIMTRNYGQGRVFHTALGHDVNSMSAAGFQRTTLRGMLWALRMDG